MLGSAANRFTEREATIMSTTTATKPAAGTKPAQTKPGQDAPVKATDTAAAKPAETSADVPLSFSEVPGNEMFGRNTGSGASEFTEQLKKSYGENGEEKVISFVVPDDAVDRKIQAVRSEAQRLGLGVTIRHQQKRTDSGELTGNTEIRFLAKNKIVRKSPTPKSGTTAKS